MFKANQQDELKLLMKDGKYDLAGITETWLECSHWRVKFVQKESGTIEREELHWVSTPV